MATDTKSTKMASAPDVQIEAPRGSRGRSPNHPNCTLQEAIERARALLAKYGKVPVAVPLACLLWGYKNPRSSSALQTISTVKSFDLVEVLGRGSGQKLAVSDAAERIIRSAPDRAELLKTVALTPTIHREVWEHFDKQLPHDDIVKRYVRWERTEGSRFTDDAVDAFIERLRSTLEYAGLISDGDGSTDEHNSGQVDTAKNGSGSEAAQKGVRVGSFVQWTSGGQDRFLKPSKVLGISDDRRFAFVEGSRTGLPMNELTAVDQPVNIPRESITPPPSPFFESGSIHGDLPAGKALERTQLDEGAVLLEWPDKLSPESVEDFQYWVVGRINRVRRKANLPRIRIEEVEEEEEEQK